MFTLMNPNNKKDGVYLTFDEPAEFVLNIFTNDISKAIKFVTKQDARRCLNILKMYDNGDTFDDFEVTYIRNEEKTNG